MKSYKWIFIFCILIRTFLSAGNLTPEKSHFGRKPVTLPALFKFCCHLVRLRFMHKILWQHTSGMTQNLPTRTSFDLKLWIGLGSHPSGIDPCHRIEAFLRHNLSTDSSKRGRTRVKRPLKCKGRRVSWQPSNFQNIVATSCRFFAKMKTSSQSFSGNMRLKKVYHNSTAFLRIRNAICPKKTL